MKKKIYAYEKKIYKVLEEQNFIIGKREKCLIKEQILLKRRYFFMTGKRIENGKTKDRFIKIPKNNTQKLLIPFKRQILCALYFKSKKIIKTRGVIAYNYNKEKGTPFVVMETFPIEHSKIGFIKNNEGVERLGIREAKSIIDQLIKLHSTSVKKTPISVKKILKEHPGDYIEFERRMGAYLNKKVKPIDGSGKIEPFYKTLERRLKTKNIKDKIKSELKKFESIINSKENKISSFVHGDMAPNNLYVFDSGNVEFLDLEWVGISKNKAMAMIIDFGNIRARSWKNKKFRKILDSELIKYYQKQGKKDLGEAIVKISTIRSHIRIARFLENYDWKKQKNPMQKERKIKTEEDLRTILK